MSIRRHGPSVVMLLMLAGALGWSLYEGPEPPLAMALLLPGNADERGPLVSAWQRAAQAEGLPLAVVRDDALLRPRLRKPARFAGLILPDSLHPAASAGLLDRLQGYVEQGGKLMVVYDAASLPPSGHVPAVHQSLLSRLVGVDYAAYRHSHTETSLALSANPENIPRQLLLAGLHSMAKSDDVGSLSWVPFAHSETKYAHFDTTGTYRGQALLRGSDGSLIAGLHQSGKGQVAFVNLELGRLGMQTDPALLRRFLSWFGTDVCGFPLTSARSVDAESYAAEESSSLFGRLKSLKIRDLDQGASWE